MGEIDTKSIESVQAALCYFGEKNELRKPYRDDPDTRHKDLIDELHKELANYKVQLEAKESENLQASLTLQHYQKTVRELSAQLEKCEAARDAYMGESRAQIEKLEFEMADQQSEASKVKEQLSLRNQMVQDMEHQLVSNSLFIESLQSELQRATEMSSCSEKVVELLKAKLEDEDRRSSKQTLYIESLNMEHGLLRMELKSAKEDKQLLSCQVENLTEELDSVKLEWSKRENELRNDVEVLKSEQEANMLKVNEFRTRTEQAESRAESAERAKVAVEGQLRNWREQMQKRKAAAKAALRQETLTLQPQHIHDDNDRPLGKYQPLGKVLNMKF